MHEYPWIDNSSSASNRDISLQWYCVPNPVRTPRYKIAIRLNGNPGISDSLYTFTTCEQDFYAKFNRLKAECNTMALDCDHQPLTVTMIMLPSIQPI